MPKQDNHMQLGREKSFTKNNYSDYLACFTGSRQTKFHQHDFKDPVISCQVQFS